MTVPETGAAATDSIGRKAGRGLGWSLAGTMATKVGSFAMALVLARLLTPADFGAYAIALAATQIVMHINDVGLIGATVQWRGKLEEMQATATTLAFVFSVLIYSAFYLGAPAFAELAGDPAAAGVVRLLTVVIIIDGITAVRAASLMRNFQQDKLAKANALGFAVGAAVTIGLASAGEGAYSFAGGQVAGNVVTGILVLLYARVPFRIGIDRAVTRKLMAFGIPLALSLGVESVLLNADYVIVGNVTGTVALGFYLLAFNISSWVPGVLGTAIRYVSIAGFSRLSEQDSEVLSAGVARSVPLLVTGLVPVAVLIGGLSPQLVHVLFGGQWSPAAAVLRFLMVLTVVRMLTAFALDILTGAGKTRSTLWFNLGWAVVLVPALLIGTHLGGINGAGLTHAIVGLFIALPLAAFALHRAGVRLAPIGPTLMRPLLGGAVALAVVLVVARLTGSIAAVQLVVAGAAGILAYVPIAVSRAQMREWLTAIRRREAPVAVARTDAGDYKPMHAYSEEPAEI